MKTATEESPILMDENYLRFLRGSQNQDDAHIEAAIQNITSGQDLADDCAIDFRSSFHSGPCLSDLNHSDRVDKDLIGGTEDVDAANAATAAVTFAQMLLAHADQNARHASDELNVVLQDLSDHEETHMSRKAGVLALYGPFLNLNDESIEGPKDSKPQDMHKGHRNNSRVYDFSSRDDSTRELRCASQPNGDNPYLHNQMENQNQNAMHIFTNQSQGSNHTHNAIQCTESLDMHPNMYVPGASDEFSFQLDIAFASASSGSMPGVFGNVFTDTRAAGTTPRSPLPVMSKCARSSPMTTSDISASSIQSDANKISEAPIALVQCLYRGKKQNRCSRQATGLDGRCAIHKSSQFCKHPRCDKFNQGNGFCIRHGGGKKCKVIDCTKQVQGYGYCSGHGGKPLCPVEGCENKRMEGGYCKAHGGGRFCQFDECKKRDIGGGFCIAHGGGKKCKELVCGKVDRGGGYCKRHGGGKKCEIDLCNRWAVGGGVCPEHKGPGKRCKTIGCTKYDLGGGHCIAHGGGRKCIVEGCNKIRQVNKRCRGHGGKLLCSVEGCERAAQNFKLCKTHGGGKRCLHEGCSNMQKGGGFCIRHGGGTKCKTEGCQAVDRGGGHCKAHGGGKKCNGLDCKKWVIGGGFCPDHLDFVLIPPNDDPSHFGTPCAFPGPEGIVL